MWVCYFPSGGASQNSTLVGWCSEGFSHFFHPKGRCHLIKALSTNLYSTAISIFLYLLKILTKTGHLIAGVPLDLFVSTGGRKT